MMEEHLDRKIFRETVWKRVFDETLIISRVNRVDRMK